MTFALDLPQDIASFILHSLSFESKARCEVVSKPWNKYLFDKSTYQAEKEEYFSKNRFDISAIFFEIKIIYEYISINLRNVIFGQKYTTYA